MFTPHPADLPVAITLGSLWQSLSVGMLLGKGRLSSPKDHPLLGAERVFGSSRNSCSAGSRSGTAGDGHGVSLERSLVLRAERSAPAW